MNEIEIQREMLNKIIKCGYFYQDTLQKWRKKLKYEQNV